jgi:PAS domain S-box-containing protein
MIRPPQAGPPQAGPPQAGPDPTANPMAGGPPGLLEQLPDGVLVLDAEQRITYANKAAIEMTGHGLSELIGERCAELLDVRDTHGKPVMRDGWHASSRLRTTKRIAEQAVCIRTGAGLDLTLSVTGSYTRDSGRVTGAVLMLRRRGHNDGAGVSGIEIVSTVSHELRSPLTSVKGYTSLMLNRWDRLLDDQKHMMLEQVNHDADRVTRLITELLDISRLESGRLVLRRQLVELPRLTASVVEKVRLEYPTLEVRAAFPDGFPKVYADPDKVEQVLTNLLENACKYGSPQGLEVTGNTEEGFVSVQVTDRGEGIPEGDLPKVFTKFFRRSVGRPTGSGLGLWISRGLVEAHGGELSARSRLGQGSTFRFTLPLVDLEKLQEQ